jgi:hypothetical protein
MGEGAKDLSCGRFIKGDTIMDGLKRAKFVLIELLYLMGV